MEPRTSCGQPVWFLLLGTLGAIIGFSWSDQDYVAATVLAAMALAGLWGYFVGALRLVGFFGALVAAYLCAPTVGTWLTPYIAQRLDTPPGATRLIGLGAGGGVTFLLGSVSCAVLVRRLLRDQPQLEAANRLIGFATGGMQGAAAMLLLLSGIQMVEPQARQRINTGSKGDNLLARAVARRVVEIAEHTRRSSLAGVVAAYNPFERLPQLKSVQHATTILSNPEKLQQAMRSPTIARSAKKSEMRNAIEQLAQDPQLRKLAESGKPLDPTTAMSLISHPGIAKLLEQPDLMQQLSETMNELDEQSALTTKLIPTGREPRSRGSH